MDVENRQRQDISPYERGLSFARYLRGGYFESQDQLARSLKISQSQVSRLLTLARLPSVVVSAFASPLDIREGWGPDLIGALQDVRRRDATIARARALASANPRPRAIDVYQQLAFAPMGGRKISRRLRDEVVTAANGTPLFRIRPQERVIAVLLPRESISRETLDEIRDALRNVLQRQRCGPVGLKQSPAEILSNSIANIAATQSS
jgi:ParB-like chromosome segregation protein Spo0J